MLDSGTTDRIVSSYASGKTQRRVATDLGISVDTVRSVLRQREITIRPAGRRSATVDPVVVSIVLKMHSAGCSHSEIAGLHRRTTQWVSRILQRSGIGPSDRGRRPTRWQTRQAITRTYLASADTTIMQTAEQFGVTSSTVASILHSQGIDTPRPKQGTTEATKDRSVGMYLTGMSMAAVGTQVGVTRTTVARILKERGVKPRSRGRTPGKGNSNE